MARLFALTVTAASIVISSPVRADEASYTVPEFLSTTPPMPPRLGAGEVWRLTLADALAYAIEHNLDIVLARSQVAAAQLGESGAAAAFEPTVTADYSHNSFRAPPVSLQEGQPGDIITSVGDSWSVGVRELLPTGTNLNLGFANQRSRSTGGTAVSPINFRSQLSLAISHPLLRGFSPDLTIPRIAVLRARLATESQREALALQIAAIVERTESAYWTVLSALYQYDLAQRSQREAEAQMTLTQRQIDAGTLAPSDLVTAESELARRALALVGAEQQISAAFDELRGVLNVPRDQWSRAILPVDVPRFAPRGATDDAALELALRNRPELTKLALDEKLAWLAVRKANNDRLPQIDVSLGGTLVGQEDHYGGALSQLSSTDTRGWTIGINLIWTPLARAGGAAVALAKREVATIKTQRDQQLQRVWLEVRAAVRNQQGAERQVRAAARFRELAEKSFELERRKFVAGQSNNRSVAQAEDAVLQARLAELTALIGHTTAATAYHRATGRLLVERNIELR